MIKAYLSALVIVMMMTLGVLWAATAHATPGCVNQPWLYGGLFGRWTTRTICDSPVRADGSWTRYREFYARESYVPVRCSWSSYGGSCYGGYWLPEFDTGVDEYPVTPDTVLPDEPGHIE